MAAIGQGEAKMAAIGQVGGDEAKMAVIGQDGGAVAKMAAIGQDWLDMSQRWLRLVRLNP